VQGTINGYGERCGNANLVSIIPTLQLKLGLSCVTEPQLSRLRHVSRTMDSLANRVPWSQQPYVGQSAFAHKGGVHVDAVKKNPRTYEHVTPEAVGNQRRILVSDLSGRANVELKARELGLDLDPASPQTRAILAHIKELEYRGYQFETASASFKLVLDEAMGQRPRYFTLRDLTVVTRVNEQPDVDPDALDTTAVLDIEVGGELASVAARGNGPVHAMDKALRTLLEGFYPELRSVRLIDYKVRVLNGPVGTGSVVRVSIESSDDDDVWSTAGVSHNVIHASWDAMVDALEYKLARDNILPRGDANQRRSRIPTSSQQPVPTA